MVLYPKQAEAVGLIREAFKKHKRVILCAPTGAGKTVMFSEIAWKTFLKGKRVMILTHRKELLKQAGKFNQNGCEICMVETLQNKIKKGTVDINQIDLMIIDEAHVGNFKKVLEHYKGFVIGATATPIAKPSLSLLYEEIVCNMDIPSLIADGKLSQPRTFLKTSVDVSGLAVSKGEYTPGSLDFAYNKPKVYSGLVNDYVNGYMGVKAIVFCVNVEHTTNVHSEFINRGVNSFCVHSKMSESDRDRQIELYTASTDGVLVNCGICTTGFDVPDIRLVIVNRATMSLTLWLQMIGRGSRILPGYKEAFTVLDYGENIKRLGHWEADRDWRKLFFTPDKKRGEQAAPVKECPGCRAIVYASARICPHCTHVFDIKSVPISEGELIEMFYKKITGKKLYDLTYDELIEVARVKRYKNGFIERALFARSVELLNKFWDDKGYQPGYRYRKLESFKDESPMKNFYIKP